MASIVPGVPARIRWRAPVPHPVPDRDV